MKLYLSIFSSIMSIHGEVTISECSEARNPKPSVENLLLTNRTEACPIYNGKTPPSSKSMGPGVTRWILCLCDCQQICCYLSSRIKGVCYAMAVDKPYWWCYYESKVGSCVLPWHLPWPASLFHDRRRLGHTVSALA